MPFGRSISSAGLIDFTTEQVRYLTFGRVLDTTLAQTTFGLTPRYSTLQAFESFLARREVSVA
ncbi:unannotated protein [freshwater metagenome]